MSFMARTVGVIFTGQTNTYTPASPGTGTEMAPPGATNVTIELGGGGGGGARDTALLGAESAGASGGYVRHLMAVVGGSTTFTYSIGAAGVGRTTTDGPGTAGTASSIVSPALTAGGGGPGNINGTNSSGGTATGGNTTNTPGNGVTQPNATGGAAITGLLGFTSGAGGNTWEAGSAGSGQNGGVGTVRFTYT